MREPLTGEAAANFEAIRENCGFYDASHHTLLHVAGSDAASFLHNLCTHDIKALAAGNCCEAFFCNVQGKILEHANVLAVSDSEFYLETWPDRADSFLQQLDKYLIREDVQLTDASPTRSRFLVTGPKAQTVINALRATHDSLGVWHAGYLGTDTLLVDAEVAMAATIKETLASHASLEFDHDLWERLRINSGYPRIGREISDNCLPQELCRDSLAISFTKGCYLGQETVARIDALGHVNWNLARLDCGDFVPEPGQTIHVGSTEDKSVGTVTSACHSPQTNRGVALCRLRREQATAGNALVIDGHGVNVAAE